MEQARLIIAIALSFLVIFAWQFFMVEPEVAPPTTPQVADQTTDVNADPDAPPGANSNTTQNVQSGSSVGGPP